MKKLDRFILRSFIGPMILTFTIAVFVLLMQFVWRYIDDLVGKGLSFGVMVELLFYAAATFVPMALPIAVLFASIMTMGNLGERYELIAIKAGGVSLRRAMRPLLLVSVLLTAVAFYFSNNVLPAAMMKYKITLFDISRKKPALNIKPSEYYTDIEGYVIRANEKDNETGFLRDIIIYDHGNRATRTSVVAADSGNIRMTPDERYMVFTLWNGCSYTEDINSNPRQARPFTRVDFEEQMMTFDLSSFAFRKSNDNFFKGNYQMMNINQLSESIDTLNLELELRYAECNATLMSHAKGLQLIRDRLSLQAPTAIPAPCDTQRASLSPVMKREHWSYASELVKTVNKEVRMYDGITESDQQYINRYHIELQRKFTLSFACIVLFLIGAPFGSIVRKGGMGIPLVASVAFFVLYYMIGMIAEKAVRESALGASGMWLSTAIMLPIGLILTLYATTDGQPFRRFRHKKRLKNVDTQHAGSAPLDN